MKHLIHVRCKPSAKVEKAILAEARKVGGTLDCVTDKGGTFNFPTLGASELFRDRINSNYSTASADHVTEAN